MRIKRFILLATRQWHTGLSPWIGAIGLVLNLAHGLVQAQGIESIVAPGKLIQAHQKAEEECKNCHTRFDRNAQDGLCMKCHKEIAVDLQEKSGLHGRNKAQLCRSCHTDHKGRNASIVKLNKKTIDHAQTDFELREKHQSVECEKCHIAGKKFREASSDCNACHRKDDTHKGSLGPKCADCHTEATWKEAKFDHEKTRFALTGKHPDVKCTECHKNSNYKETPRNCYACHRKDDDQKGHKGQFGEKCESCHTTKLWKPSNFNHDADTRYTLQGKHRTTSCITCHIGPIYRIKLVRECVACHKKDDKHKETLGKECGNCHNEKSWKESLKFDHETSSFPLLGKHPKVECKQCHKSVLFKEAPKECIGCHQKDDKHADNLGNKCADCHNEHEWKSTSGRFFHDRTKFALRNAHSELVLKCNACHKDLHSFRNTSLDCLSCHKKDDKHQGQLGGKCEQCHSDKSWKSAQFDHAQSRFPLTGRHAATVCKECHETSRYKDAPRDCYACHQNQDKHKLKFGMRCETCHNTRSWSLWNFDHSRQSSFRLDGAHQRVLCESCHKAPAPRNRNTATVGATCTSCHQSDDVHDGQFGRNCEQCHSTENWKKISDRVSRLNSSESVAVLPQSHRASRSTP